MKKVDNTTQNIVHSLIILNIRNILRTHYATMLNVNFLELHLIFLKRNPMAIFLNSLEPLNDNNAHLCLLILKYT